MSKWVESFLPQNASLMAFLITMDLNGMMDARNADVKMGWLPATSSRAIAQVFPIRWMIINVVPSAVKLISSRLGSAIKAQKNITTVRSGFPSAKNANAW